MLITFAALLFVIKVQADVRPDDVTFYLFTQLNPNTSVQLNGSESLENINITSKIVFLIHGLSDSRNSLAIDLLKNAFFANLAIDQVIIEVDYSRVAYQWPAVAVNDVPDVGKFIGNFIIELIQCGIPLRNIHLVGFSLGGQITGATGRYLLKHNLKLSRITALDPGGIFFNFRNGLNKRDADVVLVIHSNGYLIGVGYPVGTIDIFPNGGIGFQPGCVNNETSLGDSIGCSHYRSVQLFAEALDNPNTLVATQCKNYEIFRAGGCKGNKQIDLAGNITLQDEGAYYLITRGEPPYGLGPNNAS